MNSEFMLRIEVTLNRSELIVNDGGAHGYLMRTQELYDECLQKSDAFLTSLHLLNP